MVDRFTEYGEQIKRDHNDQLEKVKKDF